VLSRAERALAVAETVEEVKEIWDTAEAYRVWARTAEQQNLAASVKLRAAAKGGELLDADPALGKGKSDRLSDLFPGVAKPSREQLSARWQRIYGLSRVGTLKAYLASGAAELTMAGLFTYATTATINASTSSEWYTPPIYLEAARRVLGHIDLDPASSAHANEIVRAKRYFAPADDSLSQEWHGRVFLNPPYGKSAPQGTAVFVPKLVSEYKAGHTKAAVLLVSAHGTETEWFTGLWDHVLCFTNHRVPYWNPDIDDGPGPTFGSVFAYLGPDGERFAECFGAFGTIVRRWP
jgi:ParB family chromosome partitioning protein